MLLSGKVVLADVIRMAGRPADSIPIYEGVLAIRAKSNPNSPKWADTAFRLAQALRDGDRTERAVELARAALAIERAPGGDESQAAEIEAWLSEGTTP